MVVILRLSGPPSVYEQIMTLQQELRDARDLPERSNESRPPRHMRELRHLHKLSAIWFRILRVVLLNKHLGSISWLVGLVSCPVFASVLGGHLSQAGVQTTVRVNAFFVSLCEFHVVSGSCCVLSTASCGSPKRNQAARIPV